MKKLFLFLLIALMLVPGAFAQEIDTEDIARQYIPEDAHRLSEDGGGSTDSYTFWSDSTQELYYVMVWPNLNRLRMLSSESLHDFGSEAIVLSEEDVREAVLALYPEASISNIYLNAYNGLYSYKIYFTSAKCVGSITLNPETGSVIARDLDYSAYRQATPVSAETVITPKEAHQLLARQLAPSYSEKDQIRSFELVRTDRSWVYTGHIQQIYSDRVDKRTFVMDAFTGRFEEWSRIQIAERRPVNSASPQGTPTTDINLIGTVRACEIAIKKVSSGEVYSLKLEYDDGHPTYEIEVRFDIYKYEFEIDGYTGEILSIERDYID